MMIIVQMESERLVTHLLVAMGDLLALLMGRSVEKNTSLDIDRGERLLEGDEILEEESSGFK